jgi:hypothetical protein
MSPSAKACTHTARSEGMKTFPHQHVHARAFAAGVAVRAVDAILNAIDSTHRDALGTLASEAGTRSRWVEVNKKTLASLCFGGPAQAGAPSALPDTL